MSFEKRRADTSSYPICMPWKWPQTGEETRVQNFCLCLFCQEQMTTPISEEISINCYFSAYNRVKQWCAKRVSNADGQNLHSKSPLTKNNLFFSVNHFPKLFVESDFLTSAEKSGNGLQESGWWANRFEGEERMTRKYSGLFYLKEEWNNSFTLEGK